MYLKFEFLCATPLTFETIPKSEITASIEDLDHLFFSFFKHSIYFTMISYYIHAIAVRVLAIWA